MKLEVKLKHVEKFLLKTENLLKRQNFLIPFQKYFF